MICVSCLRETKQTNDADTVLHGAALCLTHAEAQIARDQALYAKQAERRARIEETQRGRERR